MSAIKFSSFCSSHQIRSARPFPSPSLLHATKSQRKPTIHPHTNKSRLLPSHALPDALQPFIATALSPTPGLLVGASINSLVYLLGIKVLLKGLTWEGVISSWFLGTLSYSAFGLGSYFIVCLYFIVGSLVTKIKLEQKQKEGIAEARSGRRGVASVLGSGSAGIVCAAVALLCSTTTPLMRIGYVASFASKLADTASSEIGKAYGSTTYLITNLQPVPRGTEGAVSGEGTGAGVVAAIGVAAVGWVLGQVNGRGVVAVVVAAVLANIGESVVGARVQGRVGWVTNDVVNSMQITFASVVSILLYMHMPSSLMLL